MELDQYKVDVIHFINPHLIWVLVQNEGDEDAIYFEQIGIYGILPQNVTFGGVDCVLKAERCEQWMPAASVAMKRCFLDAVEVWFSPTYIDKKSSIFDDNTHKYGDLIVIKKNGDKVSLLDEILNSEFAYEDEYLFHQELSGNNLTQLNYVTTHEVMKNIQEAHKTRDIPKTTWLALIKKQTSVLEERKYIESSVTPRSLAVCDRGNVDSLLQNKLNVLKLCKDVDEVSMGRACGTRSSLASGKSSVVNMALKKKLEWLESQSLVNQPKQAGKPETINSENSIHLQADKQTKDIQSEMNANDDDFEDEQNNNTSPKKKNHLSGYDKNDNIAKDKKPRQAVDKNKTLVAYGPAGLQAHMFTLRPWAAKEEKEERVTEEKRKPEPKPENDLKKSQDVYANTDSERNP